MKHCVLGMPERVSRCYSARREVSAHSPFSPPSPFVSLSLSRYLPLFLPLLFLLFFPFSPLPTTPSLSDPVLAPLISSLSLLFGSRSVILSALLHSYPLPRPPPSSTAGSYSSFSSSSYSLLIPMLLNVLLRVVPVP